MRLGILPAAGKSDRWGGYPKELLPISTDRTFLSRAVNSLQVSGCDFVLVVTNPSKIHLHAYHLKDWRNVRFAIQQGDEMWSALLTAMETPADEYFFMMPDTYIPNIPFPATLKSDFSIGLFRTEEPERFGVLRDGKVINKEFYDTPCDAWGALAWTGIVSDYWKAERHSNYTDAINGAIDQFAYDKWKLDFYFDVGSMEHYAGFLLGEYANEHAELQGAIMEESSNILAKVT